MNPVRAEASRKRSSASRAGWWWRPSSPPPGRALYRTGTLTSLPLLPFEDTYGWRWVGLPPPPPLPLPSATSSPRILALHPAEVGSLPRGTPMRERRGNDFGPAPAGTSSAAAAAAATGEGGGDGASGDGGGSGRRYPAASLQASILLFEREGVIGEKDAPARPGPPPSTSPSPLPSGGGNGGGEAMGRPFPPRSCDGGGLRRPDRCGFSICGSK